MGTYSSLIFTDQNGNDFIATISDETIIPDEFIIGKEYDIVHSGIMTRSIPGIYPQVYEIVERE